MDLLEDDRKPLSARRRHPLAATAAVGAALALLALGQAAAVIRAPLPGDAELAALPNGYSYRTEGREAVLGFQLTNDGSRPLRVESLGADLPGLDLVDVTVSGEPFAFETAGGGEQPLPAFDLPVGTVVEVALVYRLRSCDAVPGEPQPMPAQARDGRRAGTLLVDLPRAPAEDPDAGPDDEDEWQVVLVRDLCA